MNTSTDMTGYLFYSFTDKRAFFLVSTSSAGPQIYELTTSSTAERQGWMDMILQTQTESKKAGRRGESSTGTNAISSIPDLLEEENEDGKEEP